MRLAKAYGDVVPDERKEMVREKIVSLMVDGKVSLSLQSHVRRRYIMQKAKEFSM